MEPGRARQCVASMLRRGLGVLTAVSAATAAQTWPARPVRVIVPLAHGAPDSDARVIAPPRSATLGQPAVIENRPGANGVPGTEAVVRAEPDGHTLLMVSSSLPINPSLNAACPMTSRASSSRSAWSRSARATSR